MELTAITPALLDRALGIYLHHAYPHGVPAQAKLPDPSRLRTTEDVLAVFNQDALPAAPGADLRQYVLRLGNQHYPHMKIAIAPFVQADEWVWCVDTHDRMPIQPDSPEWPRWRELRVENLRVKAAVEADWRESGLDTTRVVAARMPRVEGTQEGPLVLVVDDELGVRTVAVNVLRRAGYRVVEAESGLEGIERFVEHLPDLVLLDFDMPGMDGGELCVRLREFEAGRQVPILMATAGGMDLSQLPGLDGFMVKPYQETLLLSFVKHQLPGDKGGSAPAKDAAN